MDAFFRQTDLRSEALGQAGQLPPLQVPAGPALSPLHASYDCAPERLPTGSDNVRQVASGDPERPGKPLPETAGSLALPQTAEIVPSVETAETTDNPAPPVESTYSQTAKEAPSYVPGEYVRTEYRVAVEVGGDNPGATQQRETRNVTVVDIGCAHTPENAGAIATAIKASGCGVVALEFTGISSQEMGETTEAMNRLASPDITPEEHRQKLEIFGHTPESAPSVFTFELAENLKDTDAEIVIIDSPEGHAISPVQDSALESFQLADDSLIGFFIREARDEYNRAALSFASVSIARDGIMAGQITKLVQDAAKNGDTRPIVVVRGVNHDQIMERVPGAVGNPNTSAVQELLLTNRPDIWPVIAYRNDEPVEVCHAHTDRMMLAKYFAGFPPGITASITDYIRLAQNMSDEHAAQVLNRAEEIMETPDLPHNEKVRQCTAHLRTVLSELLTDEQENK